MQEFLEIDQWTKICGAYWPEVAIYSLSSPVISMEVLFLDRLEIV